MDDTLVDGFGALLPPGDSDTAKDARKRSSSVVFRKPESPLLPAVDEGLGLADRDLGFALAVWAGLAVRGAAIVLRRSSCAEDER